MNNGNPHPQVQHTMLAGEPEQTTHTPAGTPTATPLLRNHKPVMSTKTFGHDIGISCCFRQWRASSHCRYLHGYAIAFKFVFAAQTLNDCNWVMDFGGLKELRQYVIDMFDHKLLVAQDDPQLEEICRLANTGAADVLIVPATGCEAFAAMMFELASMWMQEAGHSPRCWLVSVEVIEHGANSAIFTG